MSIEVKMPALSPTMEKGTLAKWLIAPGARVKAGDLIAEIETDKATMELEASDEGVLDRIVVEEGSDDVKVGTVIAVLRDADAIAPAAAEAAAPAPEIQPEVAQAVIPASKIATPAAPAAIPIAPVPSPGGDVPTTKATPLAARIARARGIEIAAIAGSGPGGKVVKVDVAPAPRDVPALVGSAGQAAFIPVVRESRPAPTIPHELIKLSTMRKTIARRLTESKTTVPHFYISNDCRLDALLALRGQVNAELDATAKLSVNDFLIKALALALKQVPDANVQYADEGLYRFTRSDISVAVAIDGGLVTPVVSDCGTKSVSQISAEAKELIDRARSGRLTPNDYEGGTASLSNLGMFGAREIIPVINPPQAVIVGVGAGRQVPVMTPDGVAGATVLTATGSFDHRAIDGATAAAFMQAFQQLIEAPLRIMA